MRIHWKISDAPNYVNQWWCFLNSQSLTQTTQLQFKKWFRVLVNLSDGMHDISDELGVYQVDQYGLID